MGASLTQTPGVARELEQRIGLLLNRICLIAAVAGGLVLVVLSVLTILSVTGRALIWLGFAPIPGDYELVEAGCAFAVFSFLPWCQLRRGHVTVDVFIGWLPPRAQESLSLIGNSFMTVAAVIIAVQLQAGLADKLTYPETTFILEMPIWYGYSAALPSAWLFAVVCVYTVWRSLNEALAGGEIAP